MGNLLINAIRHTPGRRRGRRCTGRAASDGVVLAVTDGCGGIPEDDLGRVFDVAWRGSQARTPRRGRRGGGGASGWPSSRGSVEAHGGRVDVANRRPQAAASW